jgi:hypothetical protein
MRFVKSPPGDGEHEAGVALVDHLLGHHLLLESSQERVREQDDQILKTNTKTVNMYVN